MKNAFVQFHLWAVLGAALLFASLAIFHLEAIYLFSVYAFLIFYIIALLTMLVGYYTYDKPNKILFGNAILAMMILKLIMSPFLVIWYIKSNETISQFILLPFFFSYLWFTVYELKYLLNKGKEV